MADLKIRILQIAGLEALAISFICVAALTAFKQMSVDANNAAVLTYFNFAALCWHASTKIRKQ